MNRRDTTAGIRLEFHSVGAVGMRAAMMAVKNFYEHVATPGAYLDSDLLRLPTEVVQGQERSITPGIATFRSASRN